MLPFQTLIFMTWGSIVMTKTELDAHLETQR